MHAHTPSTILVVTKGNEDPEKIHALFTDNGSGKQILLAHSWLGALEMARSSRPKVCLVSEDMVAIQGRSFPDALRDASPDVEIFIAEESDLSVSAARARIASSH